MNVSMSSREECRELTNEALDLLMAACEPVMLISKQGSDQFGVDFVAGAALKALAGLIRGIKERGWTAFERFDSEDIPWIGAEVWIATSDTMSLRFVRQYQVSHDDFLYRFDVRGHRG